MRIVPPTSDNFDIARSNEELEDLEGDELSEHPMVAYSAAATLFDLDAPGTVHLEDGTTEERTAREYLLRSEVPTFECRRLHPNEVARCNDRGGDGGALLAFKMSCKGVEHVEGAVLEVGRKKEVTDAQLEHVSNALGYDAITRIGEMVILGSRRPTRAEGKPSGSSPGAK